MTANVLENRRAKAFAEALAAHQSTDRRNGAVEGGPARGHSTAMAELLAAADTLTAAAVPAPVLDAEVRAVQRAELVAAFEREFAAGTGSGVPEQRGRGAHRAAAAVGGAAARLRPRSRWGRRLAAGGLAAGIAVGGLTGVSMASTGALPGDTLYGMKRSLEGWQLDWAGSDGERGALLLDHASTRMREARELVVRSGGDGSSAPLAPATVEQIRTALADMHAEGATGRRLLWAVYRSNGSLDPMRRLAGFARSQDDQWTQLRRRLPEQLAPVASQVTQLLHEMTADATQLHILPPQDHGGGGLTGTPGTGPRSGGPGTTTGADRTGTTGRPPSDGPSSPAAERRDETPPSATAGASATPGSTPAGGPVGGLVDGITGGLTGRGSGADGSTGTAAPGSTPADGSTATGGAKPGLTVPPLIPGLLPGVGLGLG
ncbi:DUF5667 domain-containing protein [Streptacidiphilus sp. ASG 303]|uniref:DUF5667 domain-containing protein n=1 Tax=Streptacidiphilus sp. ASG 303 TaxID=2896847 RepID=UPI001E3885E5|nr:DUF5667 domain-containing protein [Streptacidiphilus sp. ASG 303]MCD0485265.1 DUF5667 domain-containing protein [Streptacidiphilus sp. ASG 303]